MLREMTHVISHTLCLFTEYAGRPAASLRDFWYTSGILSAIIKRKGQMK